VAIVRLEQLYPWPEAQLAAVLGRYRRCREWVWVQEESQNMGGWSFAEPRLRLMHFPFEYVGRDASASPATGSHHVHEREQELIVNGAFAVTPSGPIGPGYVGWVESHGGNGEANDKPATSKAKQGEATG
jgi:2-oxoglutarate dehydrogenase E1 component